MDISQDFTQPDAAYFVPERVMQIEAAGGGP
jgi:hypothetical protein